VNELYGEPTDGWKHSDVPFDQVLDWLKARHERARLAQEAHTGRPAYKWDEPRATYGAEEIQLLLDGQSSQMVFKDPVYFVHRAGMGGYNTERQEAYRTLYVKGEEEHVGKEFFIGYYLTEPRETLVWEKECPSKQ